MTRRVRAITGVIPGLLLCGCFSPAGIYREVRSDRHKPSASDLAGTWRVTPDSAADAAATGLPLADLQEGFISLRPDGTCSGDLYPDPCGDSPLSSARRRATDACRWAISTYDKPTIMLTFGEEGNTLSFDLHRLESEPPILWQYICDPDWASYLEFQRAQP